MKILYTSVEASPFIKSSGIADFIYFMAKRLKEEKNDVRVVLPLYPSIKSKFNNSFRYVLNFSVDMYPNIEYANVFMLDVEGVKYYFIENEKYFNRARVYGEIDDCFRFIFLNKAIIKFIKEIDFKPEIVHSFDYGCALLSSYFKVYMRDDNFYSDIKTVFSTHSIKNQGIYPLNEVKDLINLPISKIKDDNFKFYDCINMLKTAIEYSDCITIPSPSFKNELENPQYSEKLYKLIKANAFKITGITEGIDTMRYDSKRDKGIFQNYDLDSLDEKEVNKIALMNYYGLKDPNKMLICVISRLLHRKGIDLLADNLEKLVKENINFIIMGNGDPDIEDKILEVSNKYKESVIVKFYKNEKESIRIISGSDAILLPSRIEAQAITHLIAMRYATVPIVRNTGVFKDTVKEYNKFTQKGEGFLFNHQNNEEFINIIQNAHSIYQENKEVWNILKKNCINKDVSFKSTEDSYLKLYENILNS